MYFKIRLFNDPATLLVRFTNFSSFNGWNSMGHRYNDIFSEYRCAGNAL